MPGRGIDARYAVRLEKNVLISMSDGTRIAADVRRPDAPGRFPVVLEYLPYRKDDIMAYRQQRHVYFAERGFACAWVDIRGTGSSGGVAADEYSRREQDDACEIIAWLADQEWSNGNVGMTGISYGGFNAIQVAMRRPPALKAIIPAYATDDRYTDDVHFTSGGALRCYDQLDYPLYMVAMNALPPHPEVVGERWAELWEEHLQAEPWVLRWLEEQTRGNYWQHGSLRPDYASIEAATLMICGWADCYRNWPLRTYAELRCPKKVLMGPWGHQWPNVAYPGPRIDYLAECVRWFNQWLGGEIPPETPDGESAEALGAAKLVVYMQHGRPPGPTLEEAPGKWRGLETWPAGGPPVRTLYLDDMALAESPPAHEDGDELAYDPAVGLCAPVECYAGHSPGLFPLDQRRDEALSLVYTGAPLAEDLEVLGYPRAVLHASATAEVAFFSVKVSDVAPDGQSTLVTRGLLNATRRSGLAEPAALEPGRVYELCVELDCCGWVFAAGHRVRVAIAGSDWPNIWPASEPSTHTVYRGGATPSRLELPLAPAASAPAPAFAPPPELATLSVFDEARGGDVFQIVEDYHEQTVTLRNRQGPYRASMPWDDTHLTDSLEWEVSVSRLHPERALARGRQRYTLDVAGGVAVEAGMTISSDRSYFHVVIDLGIAVNGALHHHKSWTRTIPRRLL